MIVQANSRRFGNAVLVTAFLLLATPGAAHASGHAAMRPGCENVLSPLELKGAGVREYSVLVFSTDVYAVYLYGPPDVSLAHLQDAKNEAAAVIEILHDDLPDQMPDELRNVLAPSLDAREMRRAIEAYRGLGESDRVTIDYEPGGGTRLAINGRTIARAPQRELMDNLLDAWLGPDAISEPLRRRLLTGDIPDDLKTIRRSIVCSARAHR